MSRPAPTRRGLTWRVLLVLALAATVPAVTVGGLAILRVRANLEREVVRGNLALVRALAASLDTTLQGARQSLDLAAAAWADERVVPVTAATASPAEVVTDRLLRRLRREVRLLATVAIFDVGGNRIAGDAIDLEPDGAAHTFGGYIGDVTRTANGAALVRVMTQARSRTGELVGTWVAELDLGFVAETLADARLNEGAHLLVVDGEGVPVARSDGAIAPDATSLRGVDPAVDSALAAAAEGTTEQAGIVTVYRNLSTFRSLRGVRWAILLQQPTAQAYRLASETARDTLLTMAVALALALVIGLTLATRLTRPLKSLAARADAIASGNPGAKSAARAPLRGPGEIGVLAERLEEMAQHLAERERLKDALARGDRLAAVGTMSASLAHELNNPLTTVLGYAKLLLEDKPKDHQDCPGLTLIADESERMQGIVRGLLDYSRSREALVPDPVEERVDINETLRKTRALLAPQLTRQRVDVALELTDEIPTIQCDPRSLQQVFVNLARNGADAMPNGGELRIRSGFAPGDVAIEVSFADGGTGVTPADRERIFEPFFTTKESGTGLGLAVARHLAGRCGATLTVGENPSGRGARFVVVIPIEG